MPRCFAVIWIVGVAGLGCGDSFDPCDSPNCDGKESGRDECGWSCGWCYEEDQACSSDHKCVYCNKEPCGNECCGDGEYCEYGHLCRPLSAECIALCKVKDCGYFDPCNCGSCHKGFECVADGKCQEICEPVCAADGVPFKCGSDSCDETCGNCPEGKEWSCVEHQCVCNPDCSDAECGDDGCGGVCFDICVPEQNCYEHQCVNPCDFSGVTFSLDATKVVSLVFGDGGFEGQALDVDGDPETCSPEGNCEGGRDNAADGVVGQVDQYWDVDDLAAEWLAGDLVLIKELVEPTMDGEPFSMRFYHGQKAFTEDTCDHQIQTCEYTASFDSFNPATCEPYNVFDNATIVDGRLRAGGEDYSINIVYIDAMGLGHEATLHQVILEADVEYVGEDLVLINGITGGAVRKGAVLDAIDHISPEEELPVSPELIKGVLDIFLIPDIDLDGDGTLDAISYGVKFSTIPAEVVGVSLDNVWGIGF